MEHGFVKVVFERNPKHFYFKNVLEGVEIGSLVVVDTVHGFQVAEVVELPETVHRNVGRWTVDKIDMTVFNNTKETRQKEKEVKARKAELKKQMKQVYEHKIVPELYEEYAKENEEMAALLKEYNEL